MSEMELNQAEDQERELLAGSGKKKKTSKGSRFFARTRKKKHRIVNRVSYPEVSINDRDKNQNKDFPPNKVTSTKYTALDFVPKVLYYEFCRVTTLYFFLVCVISLFPSISPIDPITTFSGLLFILLAALFREGIEDMQRSRQDAVENGLYFDRLTANEAHLPVRSEDIRVGDIIYVKRDQKIPADLVLLASEDIEHGTVFIETAQLDGETPLKQRTVVPLTVGLTAQEISNFQGSIECEVPHHDLFDFRGTMKAKSVEGVDESVLLSSSSFVQRGAYVRNTGWAAGVVVYAGSETKSQLNQQTAPTKFSTLDGRLDRVVLVIFLCKLVVCLILAIGAVIWESIYADDQYVGNDEDGGVAIFFKIYIGYFALLSYFIPLSLVVSLEVVKIIQARFIEWDRDMSITGNSEEGVLIRTSDITDELGAVKFIFSDKTGTLTENKMMFKKCSVAGRVFPHVLDGQLRSEIMNHSNPQPVRDLLGHMLLTMALNHSVITTRDERTDDIIFHASSPDEACLCLAAQSNKCEFIGKNGRMLQVDFMGELEEYELLEEIAFTSDRRRMSVIVRTPAGKIILYTKGADSEILARLAPGQDLGNLEKHIEDFSLDGLRTLMMGYRELSEDEYSKYRDQKEGVLKNIHIDAARAAELEEIHSAIERHLIAVGCTGIEDKLQPDLAKSLAYLREAGMAQFSFVYKYYLLLIFPLSDLEERLRKRANRDANDIYENAGINVWVITGDKTETAVNIGYSSDLLTPEMEIVRVLSTGKLDVGDQLTERVHILKHNAKGSKKTALVIDGKALKIALRDYRDELYTFAVSCAAVICTRATPIQKAKVVELVMENTKDVCLAIGDGANDVSSCIHHYYSAVSFSFVSHVCLSILSLGEYDSRGPHWCWSFRSRRNFCCSFCRCCHSPIPPSRSPAGGARTMVSSAQHHNDSILLLQERLCIRESSVVCLRLRLFSTIIIR